MQGQLGFGLVIWPGDLAWCVHAQSHVGHAKRPLKPRLVTCGMGLGSRPWCRERSVSQL